MLNNKSLKELISATRQYINLSDSVIEKDYYVTQVIQALSCAEDDNFRLVFAGGTCLAKAHKIVKRMSEDVDFKIQVKNKDGKLSKSRFLKELKAFRSQINSKLTLPDFTMGETAVRNEGQYSRIELNYSSSFPSNTSLRPHILLEFTVSEVRLSVEELSIKTLIEDSLDNVVISLPDVTRCISVEETAIEKWVGLTRRIIGSERQYYPDDPTLVRHIYDLNAIKSADRISSNFLTLAKAIVSNDAKQFHNQHPEYSENPVAEIRQTLDILKNNAHWKTRYHDFIESMVYDTISIQKYENAIHTLEEISEDVISSLNQS